MPSVSLHDMRLEKAMAAHRAGAFAAAEAGYRRVLGANRSAARALSGLGVLLVETGRPAEAVRPLGRLVQISPDGDAWFVLGVAKAASGDTKGAEAAWRRTLDVCANHIGAWNNLAGLMQAGGEYARSLDAFLRAYVLSPDAAGPPSNAALVADIIGHADLARRLVRRALCLDPLCAPAAILLARVTDDAQASRSALDRCRHLDHAPETAAGIEFALAHCAERLGDFDAATRHLHLAHKAAGQTPRARRARPDQFLDEIRAAEIAPQILQPGSDRGRDLVFIVGFPRSGTTMIEHRLASVSGIVTSGEHSPLARIDGQLSADSQRSAYRSLMPGGGAYRLFVDKLPLNIVHVRRIVGLFPDARIIAIERDPRDVVLSCYKQDWAWNDATAHFLTLDGAARLYARVMALWLRDRAAIQSSGLVLRYEDLVRTPLPALGRMADFLGLPDDVLSPARLPEGPAIETPSRHRARSAIDADACGVRTRYAELLAPVLPSLSPFVTALGYDT